MTQVSLNWGIKKFKEKVEKAVSKELLQLHPKSTFIPLTAGDLRDKEKYKALESLIFLKEKRNGGIKGRAWTDGRKQKPGSSK